MKHRGRTIMARIVWAHIIMVVIGVGVVYASAKLERSKRASGLPSYGKVPKFALMQKEGSPLELADLRGKIWVADFIYTTCPGPCPAMTSHLSRLQHAAFQSEDVRFVSFTINPEIDTPMVLETYASSYEALPQWLFVTGNTRAIHQLAVKGFTLAISEDPTQNPPLVHSTKLSLVDGDGVIRGFYDGVSEQDSARLLRDIKTLLVQKRQQQKQQQGELQATR